MNNRKLKNEFMQSARLYKRSKAEAKRLKKKPLLSEKEKQRLTELDRSISYVDVTLEKIKVCAGEDAEKMIKVWLIENKTQAEIAVMLGTTERHVRYEASKIMKKIFDAVDEGHKDKDAEIYSMAIPYMSSVTAGV